MKCFYCSVRNHRIEATLACCQTLILNNTEDAAYLIFCEWIMELWLILITANHFSLRGVGRRWAHSHMWQLVDGYQQTLCGGSLLIWQKNKSVSERGWKSPRERPEATEAAPQYDNRVFYVTLSRVTLNVLRFSRIPGIPDSALVWNELKLVLAGRRQGFLDLK